MPAPALVVLLFCSGLTALVFETLWVKQLALIVGVDVYAVTTVVSGFFAGLGAGSALLGRRADAAPEPLRLYAALEVGVAVLGVTVTLLLAHLAPTYARLAGAVGPAARAFPFLLVAAPAFLMGGTLPAAVRAAAPTPERVAPLAGRLYAANTAGGVAGTLATVLLLVPALGVRGSGIAAALLAAATAAAAGALGRRRMRHEPTPHPDAPPDSRLALVLYALAGGVALGCEVVWTQAAIPFLGTRTVAFALVLAVYLTGIVVGSAAYARLVGRLVRPWLAFGVLEIGIGVTALAAFATLGAWLPAAQEAASAYVRGWTSSPAAGLGAHLVLPPVVLLLVPAVLLGAAFPAAARLACGAEHVGTDVGAVTAANTLGGIAGTCVTGFVAIPLLGVGGTLALLAVAAAVVGATAVVHGARARRRAAVCAGVVVLALVVVALRVPRDQLARASLGSRGTLVAYEESLGGTVAVVEEPFFETTFQRLYIHGVSNSNDGLMSRRYMRLQALLPLLVHDGESRAALVVGLGTGITCGSLLAYPGLERRVCVELLPAVTRAARHFAGDYGVVDDPRVEIRIADGRQDLLRRTDRYDVITLEPPPPIAAGVVNLYSRDFYALCRERLAAHGLMAQWLPLATQNDEDTRMLVRSFLDVFPHVTLWTTELHEMLLIGSPDPLTIDVDVMARRLALPEVAAALGEVGITDVPSVLATYVTDRRGLEAYVGDAPPVTDDRPRIEHAAILRPGAFPLTLQHVLASRRDPEVTGSADGLLDRVHVRRERLLDFYQAAVDWYAGQTNEMQSLLDGVLLGEPDNPYYRWFVGG